jgi:hypothetical protein
MILTVELLSSSESRDALRLAIPLGMGMMGLYPFGGTKCITVSNIMSNLRLLSVEFRLVE